MILADGESLGAPACTASQYVYLKTVYTCVSGQVYKPEYLATGIESTTPTTITERELQTEVATTPASEPTARGQDEEAMLGDLSSYHVDGGDLSPIQERTAYDENAPATTTEQTDLVVGFVSDVMSSYAHIRDHKAKFILFASLSVALGLALFLAMLAWGAWRSSRLARLKASMPRPQQQQQNGPIDAFYTASPVHSPDSAVDIELEVGDHEVDSAFRDPAPDPLILAPPPRTRISPYGTLRRTHHQRQQIQQQLQQHEIDFALCQAQHTCSLNFEQQSPTTAVTISPTSWATPLPDSQAQAPPLTTTTTTTQVQPLHGILRNSRENSAPASDINKTVRYSTIGRPRVSSPLTPPDGQDPLSLTLSRSAGGGADMLLYG